MSEVTDALMPTMDEFIEQLYSINPVGNADMYYGMLGEYLGRQLYTKDILTFELLVKRYSDYMAYLKPYNDVEKQYIKKDKVPKVIGEYLLLSMFNDDYSKANNNPNDNYLFGI